MIYGKLKENIIAEDAYLYSLWGGVFKMYTGDIYEYPVKTSNDGKRTAYFMTKRLYYENVSGLIVEKKITCSSEPETVYNTMVWLPERDDQKAKELLIAYHMRAIEEVEKNAEKSIKNHEDAIKLIKEGF